MIDFACKQFKLDDIIKCSLGLTKAEYKIMEFFMFDNENFSTTEEISQKTGLNLSTVQRGVKKLHAVGIILRIQNNLNKGGYFFHYKANDRKIIRKILKDIIHRWVDKVDSSLDTW